MTGAKLATIVASAVGFGAIAGLVLSNPIGASATNAAKGGSATTMRQVPVPTPASDFFAVPPGFAQPPMIRGGTSGGSPGGSSGGQGGFGNQGGFSGQGGFGNQAPALRSGGS